MKNKDLFAHLKTRRAETLCSLVAEELERMIIRGELQAGDRINESELAQMLNIRAAARFVKRAGAWRKVISSEWLRIAGCSLKR